MSSYEGLERAIMLDIIIKVPRYCFRMLELNYKKYIGDNKNMSGKSLVFQL
jgi:hypothetical protein